MNKMKMMLISFISMLLVLPSASIVQAAGQEPVQVLILYDSLAKGTPKEGNVEALQRLLASFGVSTTLDSIDTYKKGDLQRYTKVIGVYNASDIAVNNQDYVTEFEAYEGDYLHIGTNIPAKLQVELNLHIEKAGQEINRLTIGEFSQQLNQLQGVPTIVDAAGTAYGSFSSTNSDKQFPYGVKKDSYAYVPFFEKGNLSEMAMAYILKDWLAAAKQGEIYLVFKEIYPFSDMKLLELLADKLDDAGIPFIVSIRPVFYNTDYPAMKRYLETLKYVQSRNGSIMVNAPVVASTINQLDRNLKTQMESFVDVLADYDIAPLGMGAEMYWVYDQQYAVDGMGFFDSVVLFPNDLVKHKSKTSTSQSFPSSMYSLPLSHIQQFQHTGRMIEGFPMDTAITYDFFENEAELGATVQTLLNSWILFADYKQTSHAVHTESNVISSSNGLLYINGHSVALNSAMTSINSEYDYKEQVEKSFEQWFSVQNKIFIVVILLTLLAFGGFFIIGYRLYMRKYYK